MRKATKQTKDLKIPFSIGVSPSLAEEIDRRATEMERSRSWLAEKLLSRALAAYKRDGLLDEPEPEVKIQSRDVMVSEKIDLKLNAPATEKKAKV